MHGFSSSVGRRKHPCNAENACRNYSSCSNTPPFVCIVLMILKPGGRLSRSPRARLSMPQRIKCIKAMYEPLLLSLVNKLYHPCGSAAAATMARRWWRRWLVCIQRISRLSQLMFNFFFCILVLGVLYICLPPFIHIHNTQYICMHALHI